MAGEIQAALEKLSKQPKPNVLAGRWIIRWGKNNSVEATRLTHVLGIVSPGWALCENYTVSGTKVDAAILSVQQLANLPVTESLEAAKERVAETVGNR